LLLAYTFKKACYTDYLKGKIELIDVPKDIIDEAESSDKLYVQQVAS